MKAKRKKVQEENVARKKAKMEAMREESRKAAGLDSKEKSELKIKVNRLIKIAIICRLGFLA